MWSASCQKRPCARRFRPGASTQERFFDALSVRRFWPQLATNAERRGAVPRYPVPSKRKFTCTPTRGWRPSAHRKRCIFGASLLHAIAGRAARARAPSRATSRGLSTTSVKRGTRTPAAAGGREGRGVGRGGRRRGEKGGKGGRGKGEGGKGEKEGEGRRRAQCGPLPNPGVAPCPHHLMIEHSRRVPSAAFRHLHADGIVTAFRMPRCGDGRNRCEQAGTEVLASEDGVLWRAKAV